MIVGAVEGNTKPPVKAYDLSMYQRVIGVEGSRVSGQFKVLTMRDGSEGWVSAIEVTVWDEDRRSGRLLYSNDLNASVKGGEVKLSKHMVASNKLADVEAVWDDMIAAILAAFEAFPEAVSLCPL